MGIKTPFDPMGVFPKAKPVDPYPDASIVLRHYLTAAQLTYTTQTIITQSDRPFDIDWGDGTRETFTSGGIKTHTFAMAGTYDVQIIDTNKKMTEFSRSPDAWRNKNFVFEILKLESETVTNLYFAFLYCYGVKGKIPDISKCPSLTNLNEAFCGCTNLVGRLPDITKCRNLRQIRNTFYRDSLLAGVPEEVSQAVSSQASITATWPSLTLTTGFVFQCAASVLAEFPTTWGGTKVIS